MIQIKRLTVGHSKGSMLKMSETTIKELPGNRQSKWLIAIVLLFCAGAYMRLLFGVDFMDEAGYVALPYSFVLGAKPYYDELAINQNVGILLYIPVKLYSLFFGTKGLVLAMRHFHFFCTGFSGFILYRIARSYIDRNIALLAALLPVCFMFFVPGLSYNSVGSLGFMLGTFAQWIFLAEGTSARNLSRVGPFLAMNGYCLAAFAYPPLILIVSGSILFAGWRISKWHSAENRKLCLATGLVVGFFWLVLTAYILLSAHWYNVQRVLDYYHLLGVNFGRRKKLYGLIHSLLANGKIGLIFMMAPIGVWVVGRVLPKLSVLAAFLIPASVLLVHTDFSLSSVALVIFFGLLPVPYLLSCFGLEDRFYLKSSWCISVCGAGVFCWTSSNGLINAALGLITACLANFFTFGLLLKHRVVSKTAQSALLAFVVGALVVLTFANYQFIYREGSIRSLTTLVRSGPFAGLRTHFHKAKFVEDLSRDLQLFKGHAKSVIFFDDFPAGYLFLDLPRHAQSVWTPGNGPWLHFDRNFIVRYYTNAEMLPDLVVHVTAYPIRRDEIFRNVSDEPDPLLGIFRKSPYIHVLENSFYSIYLKS
jgi:hypothetical protein